MSPSTPCVVMGWPVLASRTTPVIFPISVSVTLIGVSLPWTTATGSAESRSGLSLYHSDW